ALLAASDRLERGVPARRLGHPDSPGRRVARAGPHPSPVDLRHPCTPRPRRGLAGTLLPGRRWGRLLPLYVVLFGYMLTVLLFFNFARFRVPVVPILALFGSESLMAAARFLRRLLALVVAFATRAGDM